MRGHWLNRMPDIDGDIDDMQKHMKEAKLLIKDGNVEIVSAIATVLARPARLSVTCHHTPAEQFEPGKPLEISLSLDKTSGEKVNLLYRQADQSQRWRTAEMQSRDRQYRSAIPADYTQSPYPLLYYFEIHGDRRGIWDARPPTTIYPGFSPDLSNQPYFVVRSNRKKG